ncbi:MAG: hypothetical protein QOG80_3075 [Pseudonocardiales bacterium]|nr:hypothetical protein [Pseudonocardiales bacterium]
MRKLVVHLTDGSTDQWEDDVSTPNYIARHDYEVSPEEALRVSRVLRRTDDESESRHEVGYYRPDQWTRVRFED